MTWGVEELARALPAAPLLWQVTTSPGAEDAAEAGHFLHCCGECCCGLPVLNTQTSGV